MEHLTVQQVRRPDDVVSVGDEINVKVFEVDGLGNQLDRAGSSADPAFALRERGRNASSPTTWRRWPRSRRTRW